MEFGDLAIDLCLGGSGSLAAAVIISPDLLFNVRWETDIGCLAIGETAPEDWLALINRPHCHLDDRAIYVKMLNLVYICQATLIWCSSLVLWDRRSMWTKENPHLHFVQLLCNMRLTTP